MHGPTGRAACSASRRAGSRRGLRPAHDVAAAAARAARRPPRIARRSGAAGVEARRSAREARSPLRGITPRPRHSASRTRRPLDGAAAPRVALAASRRAVLVSTSAGLRHLRAASMSRRARAGCPRARTRRPRTGCRTRRPGTRRPSTPMTTLTCPGRGTRRAAFPRRRRAASSAGGMSLRAPKHREVRRPRRARLEQRRRIAGAVVSNPTPRNTTSAARACPRPLAARRAGSTRSARRRRGRAPRSRDDSRAGNPHHVAERRDDHAGRARDRDARSISPSGVTHTGHPGPEMSLRPGRQERRAGRSREMAIVCVPHTSMSRRSAGPARGSAQRATSRALRGGTGRTFGAARRLLARRSRRPPDSGLPSDEPISSGRPRPMPRWRTRRARARSRPPRRPARARCRPPGHAVEVEAAVAVDRDDLAWYRETHTGTARPCSSWIRRRRRDGRLPERHAAVVAGTLPVRSTLSPSDSSARTRLRRRNRFWNTPPESADARCRARARSGRLAGERHDGVVEGGRALAGDPGRRGAGPRRPRAPDVERPATTSDAAAWARIHHVRVGSRPRPRATRARWRPARRRSPPGRRPGARTPRRRALPRSTCPRSSRASRSAGARGRAPRAGRRRRGGGSLDEGVAARGVEDARAPRDRGASPRRRRPPGSGTFARCPARSNPARSATRNSHPQMFPSVAVARAVEREAHDGLGDPVLRHDRGDVRVVVLDADSSTPARPAYAARTSSRGSQDEGRAPRLPASRGTTRETSRAGLVEARASPGSPCRRRAG